MISQLTIDNHPSCKPKASSLPLLQSSNGAKYARLGSTIADHNCKVKHNRLKIGKTLLTLIVLIEAKITNSQENLEIATYKQVPKTFEPVEKVGVSIPGYLHARSRPPAGVTPGLQKRAAQTLHDVEDIQEEKNKEG
jgi:hypothetical protein